MRDKGHMWVEYVGPPFLKIACVRISTLSMSSYPNLGLDQNNVPRNNPRTRSQPKTI